MADGDGIRAPEGLRLFGHGVPKLAMLIDEVKYFNAQS
jgi:hypothetical protein